MTLLPPADPIAFKDEYWPTVLFDPKQEEIVRSVNEKETEDA